MNVHISKWGNSLAVRLPKEAAEAAGVGEGDVLELQVPAPGRVELRTRRRRLTLRELVTRITPENRRHETDWGAAVGREIW